MTTTLNIVLKRPSKIYHEGETIAGVVEVVSNGEVRHEGLSLVAEGGARLSPHGRPPALLDAFAANVKVVKNVLPLPKFLKSRVTTNKDQAECKPCSDPLLLVNTTLELSGPGRFPPGTTELPFELPLQGSGPLLETYHGVFVSVTYGLKATLKRSFLSKPLTATCQFFVQHVPVAAPPLKPVRCEITPGSVRACAAGRAAQSTALPHFVIYAELHSTVCSLDKPLTGKIRVEESAAPVKSIELQLVRVETIASGGTTTRDATEIQNIQIGCGDVCRSRDIPMHMVLPRLFAAPTATTSAFTIEFELNLAVIFEDDHLVTENFPILLLRAR